GVEAEQVLAEPRVHPGVVAERGEQGRWIAIGWGRVIRVVPAVHNGIDQHKVARNIRNGGGVERRGIKTHARCGRVEFDPVIADAETGEVPKPLGGDGRSGRARGGPKVFDALRRCILRTAAQVVTEANGSVINLRPYGARLEHDLAEHEWDGVRNDE